MTTTPPSTADLIERFGPPDDFAVSQGDDRTNTDRADSVRADVTAEALASPEVLEEEVGDIIVNLLHLVTMHGGDPQAVHDRVWLHFQSEVGLGYGAPVDAGLGCYRGNCPRFGDFHNSGTIGCIAKVWTYSQVNQGGADVTHSFGFTGTDEEWAEHVAAKTHEGIEIYNAKVIAG